MMAQTAGTNWLGRTQVGEKVHRAAELVLSSSGWVDHSTYIPITQKAVHTHDPSPLVCQAEVQ
jgi:hypothetical protein